MVIIADSQKLIMPNGIVNKMDLEVREYYFRNVETKKLKTEVDISKNGISTGPGQLKSDLEFLIYF